VEIGCSSCRTILKSLIDEWWSDHSPVPDDASMFFSHFEGENAQAPIEDPVNERPKLNAADLCPESQDIREQYDFTVSC
jgi:hypothetical protein